MITGVPRRRSSCILDTRHSSGLSHSLDILRLSHFAHFHCINVVSISMFGAFVIILRVRWCGATITLFKRSFKISFFFFFWLISLSFSCCPSQNSLFWYTGYIKVEFLIGISELCLGQIWSWNQASATTSWYNHQYPCWTFVSLDVEWLWGKKLISKWILKECGFKVNNSCQWGRRYSYLGKT